MSTGLWAIVPAAGVGARMHADRPKQYLPLAGKTVIEVTLDRLAAVPGISGIFVGIGENDRWWPEIAPRATDAFRGGAERALTVLNGLHTVSRFAHPDDLVLVHDAVRPCVRVSDIVRLIERGGTCADGGLLALPVADTVKQAASDNRVVATVPRDRLWRALTPQVFKVRTLADALESAVAAGNPVTDEASAIERAGGHPMLVEGAADNIKITVSADLVLAELILRAQSVENG